MAKTKTYFDKAKARNPKKTAACKTKVNKAYKEHSAYKSAALTKCVLSKKKGKK
jgi:hypothetical protein